MHCSLSLTSGVSTTVAFLPLLPELICFAGKVYVHVPDPRPECIPLAIKEKKNGEKYFSDTLTVTLN